MGIKYKSNEKFFDTWSHLMAYVLGYIYADGSLENSPSIRAKYLRITSTDFASIEGMKKWLGSGHKIIEINPLLKPRKKQFLIRIGSHKIYQALTKLGLYPNKSLTIKMPNIPKKYLANFVRGYFDGDGCVYIHKERNLIGKMLIKRLTIIFTSSSFDFLQQLSDTLKDPLDLKQNKVYKSNRSFQLRYSTEDSIKLFSFMYARVENESYMKRKVEIFKKYFLYKPNRIDKKVKLVLGKFKMV